MNCVFFRKIHNVTLNAEYRNDYFKVIKIDKLVFVKDFDTETRNQKFF